MLFITLEPKGVIALILLERFISFVGLMLHSFPKVAVFGASALNPKPAKTVYPEVHFGLKTQ